jgi:hypothetical protein
MRCFRRNLAPITMVTASGDFALAGVAVAHHQPPATLVPLGRVRG